MTLRLQGIIAITWTISSAVFAPASAQTMSDPMRPPVEYMSAASLEQDASGNESGGQILILSKDRKIATINGEMVALGGRYHDGRLVGMSEDELVFKGPGSQEIVKLYSSVSKTMRSRGISPQPARASNNKKAAGK